MMTQNPPEIRALAFVIAAIRPAWPAKLIEESLAKSSKPFDVLADDAIDAARTPTLRSPAVLATHRRPDRPLGEGTQPPPITRCTKCGHINSEHHNCRPMKPTPDWHNRRRQLAAKYTHEIRAAEAVGDWQAVAQLKTQWRTELANNPDSYRVEILNA
jgi:hypothetical protein